MKCRDEDNRYSNNLLVYMTYQNLQQKGGIMDDN